MKKLSRVATALSALLIFTASVQAEDLLKNADVAYGEYPFAACQEKMATSGGLEPPTC